MQIIFFSLLVLGPFAVLLASLYALEESGWPALLWPPLISASIIADHWSGGWKLHLVCVVAVVWIPLAAELMPVNIAGSDLVGSQRLIVLAQRLFMLNGA